MPLLSSAQKVSQSTNAARCNHTVHKKQTTCCANIFVCVCAECASCPVSGGSLCACVAGSTVLRCKLSFNLLAAEYQASAKTLIGPTP